MTASRPSAVVILAAGEGKRMKSATPKVLHMIAGRSLLGHVIEAASTLEPAHLVVVVGHGREPVQEHIAEIAPWAVSVVQEQQNGTGHAVRVALAGLADRGIVVEGGPVVVLTGDTPLLTGRSLVGLLLEHESTSASATVLTARVPDPTGYGRIVRGSDGSVTAIVEHKDADESTLQIDEINSGMYAFDAGALSGALGRLTTDNAQGEEYLTDVIGMLRSDGLPVSASVCADADEVLGVNDRVQLASAAAILRDRINDSWMREGVTIVDSASTWLDVDVELDIDVLIRPQVTLRGPTSVSSGAIIGPGTTLTSCEVGSGAEVIHTWAELAVIGEGAHVGPFTYLRPGTVLGRDTKAGAYVEIKNSTLGDGAKVPHLSYVGDADIGAGSNIGAATVTVNYDGVNKHRTVVGEHARVGSDTMLVAPVTIGDGAYTAAGSVITEDVPPGAMGVGRAQQRNVQGWVERRRPGSPAAEAAERARQDEPVDRPSDPPFETA
ncbi:MAG TPA: bifunctional UDP-N-acetylglucosamine diphosphorylase/glucosamine-1-phosphate N-acetyltransferase GlmU [Actinobacteria bacterium]|nr:bifunctional UDP-N-acetylglucosamine diphosphorylase/glucosamine-1-phosphate N-acetyltransferase GlmU [Actinomycetota bacterium]